MFAPYQDYAGFDKNQPYGLFSMYLEFEDIAFYILSVYHNNLHDKQNCIITGCEAKSTK